MPRRFHWKCVIHKQFSLSCEPKLSFWYFCSCSSFSPVHIVLVFLHFFGLRFSFYPDLFSLWFMNFVLSRKIPFIPFFEIVVVCWFWKSTFNWRHLELPWKYWKTEPTPFKNVLHYQRVSVFWSLCSAQTIQLIVFLVFFSTISTPLAHVSTDLTCSHYIAVHLLLHNRLLKNTGFHFYCFHFNLFLFLDTFRFSIGG